MSETATKSRKTAKRAPASPSKKTRQRAPQERAELTKTKILEVATQEFSERGYDAVTVREIEIKAKVQRNLLKYHFGSKEELWKTAATNLITDLQAFTDAREDIVKDLPVKERTAFVIRSYVRFSAAHPEFQRLMSQEGKQKSWRLEWLVENYLKPSMEVLRKVVKEGLDITDEEFTNWYYMFVGGGAFIFSMAPEASLLFGVDTHDQEIVDRHTNMMVDVLLSRTTP